MTFTEERAGHGGLVAMAVQLERRCVGDDSRAAWQLAQRVREGAAALLPALTTLQADFDRLSVLDSDSVSAGDYREHDEHNADVREDIADSAAALAEQIERLLWAAPAEEVSIPEHAWTEFLGREYELDLDHPGDVTLAAVLGELALLINRRASAEDEQ